MSDEGAWQNDVMRFEWWAGRKVPTPCPERHPNHPDRPRCDRLVHDDDCHIYVLDHDDEGMPCTLLVWSTDGRRPLMPAPAGTGEGERRG